MTVEELIQKDEAEDAIYPEQVRRKRQASRNNFQEYLNNMGKADYDVRYEEGRVVFAAGLACYLPKLQDSLNYGSRTENSFSNLSCEFPIF